MQKIFSIYNDKNANNIYFSHVGVLRPSYICTRELYYCITTFYDRLHFKRIYLFYFAIFLRREFSRAIVRLLFYENIFGSMDILGKNKNGPLCF